MRIVLLILLASTSLLALIGLAVRPGASPALAPPGWRVRAAALHAPTTPPRPSATAIRAVPFASDFALPLIDRVLPPERRAAAIAPDLLEAIDRVEPILDPTRLEGPYVTPVFRIWPGTVSLVDAFGEHWRLGSLDANIHRRARPYALAWRGSAAFSCDDYSRTRVGPAGMPVLSAPTLGDCAAMRRRAAARWDDAAPVPIVAAALSLPAFAAPPPGARMTSGDFWAAQRERMAAMRERLRRRWQTAGNGGDAGAGRE